MSVTRVDGMEIEQDLEFQRRSWTFQRAGWVVMILVLVAALAGLLGAGPLSSSTVTVAGALRVEYQRFSRYQTPETLVVHVDPAAVRDSAVRIGLDRDYLGVSKVETVTPPPVSVRADGSELTYEFAVGRPDQPVMVTFVMQPERLGFSRGRVVLHRGEAPETAAFWRLVYP
jgi:hypothetical protein